MSLCCTMSAGSMRLVSRSVVSARHAVAQLIWADGTVVRLLRLHTHEVIESSWLLVFAEGELALLV